MVEFQNKKETFADYDYSFQIKLLRALIHDLNFLKQIYEILSIDYFSSESLAFIANVIKESFKQYKQKITLDTFKIAFKTKNIDDVLKVALTENLKDIYKTDDFSNLEEIKDEAIRFCYNQNLKNAIFESAVLIESHKYDDIKLLLNTAMNAGIAKNTGHDYKERVVSRYTENLRNTKSCGIEVIDEITGGGFGSGELITIIAPPGVGKTWLLVSVGGNALKAGLNVLHYTCELDESYTGRRYDSYLTGINFADLEYHLDNIITCVTEVPGELKIYHYPQKTATVDTLIAQTEHLVDIGFVPDIIIVDYATILKPSINPRIARIDQVIGSIFGELRGMAGVFKVPLYTAQQANRGAMDKDIVDGDDIADTIAPAMDSDFVFSAARKREDAMVNFGRMHIIKNRFGPDKMTFPFKSNMNNGHLDVYKADSVKGNRLKRKMDTGESVLHRRLKQSYNKDKNNKVDLDDED